MFLVSLSIESSLKFMKNCCALLIFFHLSGSSLSWGESAAPKPRVIAEEEASTAAPRPRIVPEDEPTPVTADDDAAPKARIVPMEPDLIPDPLPIPPEPTPPPHPKPAEEKKPEPEPKEDPVRKGKAVPMVELTLPPVTPLLKEQKSAIPVSDRNDKNARTLFLTIPAPRGQIVDRYGAALARNKMAYFLGLQFMLKNNSPNYEVLKYAHERISYIQKHTPDGWDIADDKILEHYKNRRWLPLLANRPVPDEAQGNATKELPAGVVIVPCYYRSYPNGRCASHVLGQMGKIGGMPTTPIQNGDAIWPACEGRAGLEQRFEAALAGTPGKMNLVFSATGEKLSEEIVDHPKPGNTLVTSIDLEMQKITERVLRAKTKRGAMVIMEVATGDVLAIASNPDYDPNLFAYSPRGVDYTRLTEDPEIPMFSRATNGQYPPASTFKVMTALAALESGKISGDTEYECSPALTVGDRTFHNWNRGHNEGSMNVIAAIKRSCNTWFYKAALETGASPVTSMATRFGLGEKAGLCIAEKAGRVPTPEWWRQEHKSNMTSGDLMNICIGQGDNLVTPLQDCAMMAGIARGHSVPRARLAQQIQSLDGSIIDFFPAEKKCELDLHPESLRLVRAGMKAVVNSSDGTGTRAENGYVKVAGKTGTAQWYVDKRTKDMVFMTWFAGFMPADNPEYAFAAIYEGNPGDSISGGKQVAPIIGEVFTAVYKRKKENGDSMEGPEMMDDSGNKVRKARVAEDDDNKSQKSRRSPVVADPEPPPPEVEPAKQGGLRGLFRKVFGKP